MPADSDALRSRRKRLHAAGDHSLCRRCPAARHLTALPSVPDAPGADSGTATAFPGASGPPGGLDATAALQRLAKRLETAHEAEPGDAALARELRTTLLALRGPAGDADDERAKFWAEFSGA